MQQHALTAYRTATPPDLDGRLAADCWRRAPRSSRFVDLVSGGPTGLDTRAAVLWDDDALYVGFEVEEPRVEARLTERDAHVWLDDDVELFVAGVDRYYELEVNALNTVYEVLFEWDDAGRDRAAGPAELRGDHPQAAPFDGVDHRHPRGPRTGFWGWDLPGLVTAVHVDGRLNDPSVVDAGWSVEIALPWAGLAVLADEAHPLPPRDGDIWRIAFARFNTDRMSADDSGGWALSPHGVWDAHVPERFPLVRFSSDPPPG
ncbi:carbohydrate-binding family 9-like protein [Amnibacterium endophyticum]|uniref:Carbohydrate-binding family 9-like protein n=1 Tax=Amnibacterium endophyticum TaxID=2109337 RepID=A0ABW4LFK5_9MICO